MSEKEKKILETIAKAVPEMSEFDKGYLLGIGEGIASKKKGEKENFNDRDSGQENTDV